MPRRHVTSSNYRVEPLPEALDGRPCGVRRCRQAAECLLLCDFRRRDTPKVVTHPEPRCREHAEQAIAVAARRSAHAGPS